jgi:hypothetical protein
MLNLSCRVETLRVGFLPAAAFMSAPSAGGNAASTSRHQARLPPSAPPKVTRSMLHRKKRNMYVHILLSRQNRDIRIKS